MRKKLSFIPTLLGAVLLSLSACSHFGSSEADKDFRAFTLALFRQEAASNTITLHYTLEHPENFGISPASAPISLGSYSADTTLANAALENTLAALETYNYKKLSDENKLTYDVLKSSLETSMKGIPYALYDEPLSPLTGIQSQLPVLLSEFPFDSETDVETYLSLIEEIPACFDSLIDFERVKAHKGLFMPSYSAASLIDECKSFLALKDNNYLFSSFQQKIDAMEELSDKQKDAYTVRHKELVNSCVFPSYNKLVSALTSLKNAGTNINGLYYYPDGKAYYEYVVERDTGSDKTVAQLQDLTRRQVTEDLTAMQDILASDKNAASKTDFQLKNNDPANILETLQGTIASAFPKIPDVDVQVKKVSKEMEEFLSPAFYMVPPLDNASENVIYINEGHLPDDLTLFTTLAHEGYPGHLYQNVYYASTNPDPIRGLLGFGGYTEGWATYVEMMSYYYTDMSKEQATLEQKNSSVILGLYALADMGIHYSGWTLTETVSFFRQFGITDTETVKDIFYLIIGDPGNYLKYYIGYVEFLELKKTAVEEWGEDFTQADFHRSVLNTGPAPFKIVEEQLLDGVS